MLIGQKTFSLDELHKEALERAKRGAKGNAETQNLWGVENTAENCIEFIKKLKTWDEASEMEASFPDQKYLWEIVRKWYWCRDNGRRFVIEKARRLIVSYLMSAIELFQAGHSRNNGLVQHLDLTKAEKELWRIWQLYMSYRAEHAPMLPTLETHGNEDSQKLERLIFPNGSIVERHYQEGGAVRGSGYSRIRLEELSAYRYPRSAWGQAKILTQGKPDEGVAGGFSYAVCNSSPHPEWLEIKNGVRARDLEWVDGMCVKELPDGTIYMVVHYTANSLMTAEWADKHLRDVPAHERRREYELHDDVYDGKPVYPMYEDSKHFPASIRGGGVPFLEGSQIIVGLDCGTAIRVAGVVLQVTRSGQILTCREVCPVEPASIEELVTMCMAEVEDLAPGLSTAVHWCADATVKTRTGSRKETSWGVARQTFGINIKPISNQLVARISAVNKALTDTIGGNPPAPRFILDGNACPHLRKGFQGAYRYQERQSDQGGSILTQPVKDEFSHVQDALQYAMIRAWQLLGSMIVEADEPEPSGQSSNTVDYRRILNQTRKGAYRGRR